MSGFRFFSIAALTLTLVALLPAQKPSQRPVVRDTDFPGALGLVVPGAALPVLVDSADATVVRNAAENLTLDIERVTGRKPELRNSAAGLSGSVIIVGSLDSSPLVQSVVAHAGLDLAAIQGQWETFTHIVVDNPLPGLDRALLIAGSDRRGAAYGVYELSEAIGVSPWYWWADVPPKTKSALYIGSDPIRQGPPSVKYRGIFINDEDWGLQEWSEHTYEPEVGDIGPKSHAAIFELLLRVRANYCWPGMHPSTKAFNHYEQNKQVADDYAIVMGSSHAEPMLRNNVDEWYPYVEGRPEAQREWNFVTNRETVLRYWEDRVEANGQFENVYTVGMRGIHDSGMVGGGSMADQRERLEEIIGEQRAMLARHVNPDASQVPQAFIPYKEVLEIYESGMNLPDDITLVYPDDNHGYIRRLPNAAEMQRSGGGGVYYHISYWGRPKDYLWITSTPISLIWNELMKAYHYNAKELWVINVGDIKPAEPELEFCMRLGWNVDDFTHDAQNEWWTQWAAREFGPEHAADIAAIMNEYQRLGYLRKPEHMDWRDTDPQTAAKNRPLFSYIHGETSRRLMDYQNLIVKIAQLTGSLPPEQKDAFFQLVSYRVQGAALMNQKFLDAGKTFLGLFRGDASTNHIARLSNAAYQSIVDLTLVYNTRIAGGKWNRMMDYRPRGHALFNAQPTRTYDATEISALGITPEGRLTASGRFPDNGDSVNPASLAPIVLPMTGAQLTAPMAVQSVAGRDAILVPELGRNMNPGDGGRATLEFNAPATGVYSLDFRINCPNAETDSWHIQLDDTNPVAWNGNGTNGRWRWSTWNGELPLTKGTHTLTIHERESGSGIAEARLTYLQSPQPGIHDRIVLDLASAKLKAPMAFVHSTSPNGYDHIATPGEAGGTPMFEPGAGGAASIDFDVVKPGEYDLMFFVNGRTGHEDSWFIQLDDGEPELFNENITDGRWIWKTFKRVELSAGPHTLTVHEREDGSYIGAIQFVHADIGFFELEDPRNALPEFNRLSPRTHFITLFNRGTASTLWTASANHPAITLSDTEDTLNTDNFKLEVSIDWTKAPKGWLKSTIDISDGTASWPVAVRAWSPETDIPDDVGYIEVDGVVSIEAARFSRSSAPAGQQWIAYPHTGRHQGSTTLWPPTGPSFSDPAEIKAGAPSVEYRFYLRAPGAPQVTATLLPTHAVNGEHARRYAIAIDDEEPQIVDLGAMRDEHDAAWQRSVLRSEIVGVSNHAALESGAHTLRVWNIDPGVIFDQFTVTTGWLPDTYLGPKPTYANHGDWPMTLTIRNGLDDDPSPDNSITLSDIAIAPIE